MGTLADALAPSGPSFSWEENSRGSVEGIVVDTAIIQARKFGTNDPDFWDDGKPKELVAITISTELRDPSFDDDDGRRTLYITLWSGQKRALQAAAKLAGVKEPTVGDTFKATHVSGAGRAGDPRVFEYVITKGAGIAAALDTNDAPATPDLSSLGLSAEQLAGLSALKVVDSSKTPF